MSLSDLHDRLDDIWASYLEHLDNYTKAQKLLQKHMIAGFLSLARANFNSRDGVTRYGKDFYHERAVASRRAAVWTDGPNGKVEVELVSWREEPKDEPASKDEDQKDDPTEAKQQPSPPATPEPTTKQSDDTDADTSHESDGKASANKSSTSTTKLPLASDPLRWFGILIPRELRSAHTSFCAALDEAAVGAINATRSMRKCEVEVRKLRKDIKRAEKVANSGKEEARS
ncbi:uncharacterized protein LTR77_010069 [Saxophila tyrrhenica]|uniref:Vacuolar ATPase assembly protein VMA22 n=1 Tax=Saxophila tyrrhenica TaxID=1690608 RepID=A0AAV9P0V3_9PEZI|nr:hypothetical protein LTR77_010069 [Saxophila tyrrhenica]